MIKNNIRFSYKSVVTKKLADELDKHRNQVNSGFRTWLRYDITLLKVVLVKDPDDNIIGWAGFNTKYCTNGGVVGVYIDPDHRGKKLATHAIDYLLKNLKKYSDIKTIMHDTYPDWKCKFFSTLIKNNGFVSSSVY